MPRQVITVTAATLTLGPTATSTDFSCQVNVGTITPTANNVDVPATFCAGASQTAAPSSFALDLTILQDWGAVKSVSQYLFDHDAEVVDFELEGIGVTGSTVTVTGQVTVVAGALGGEAGTPLTADVSLPILGKPTVVATPPTVTAAEAEDAEPNTFQPA
jgi:hypothetical protein